LNYGEKIQKSYNDIITKYPNITKTQKETIIRDLQNNSYEVLLNAVALYGFWGEGFSELFVNEYPIYPNKRLNPIYFGYYTNGTKKPSVVTPTITNVQLDPMQEAENIATDLKVSNAYVFGELNGITVSDMFLYAQYNYSEKFKKIYNDLIISYPNISEKQKEIIMANIVQADDNEINNALGLLGFYGNIFKDNLIANFNNDPQNWLNPTYFKDNFQNLTQSAAATKESIQAIIKGYEIKLKRGDNSAASIIKGYQIKLKRL
jgi:hypothetical protein